MKKDRKLVITEKQLRRINEVFAVGGTYTNFPTNQQISQNTSYDNANQTFKGNARLKVNASELGDPDTVSAINKASGVDVIADKQAQLTEANSFTKKAVEEARIRTIKQEGKTYSKANFAKMILGK